MSAPVVHSTVHNLWRLVRAHESTGAAPLIVGTQVAEQLAHLLARDDGITLPEARVVVRALLLVGPLIDVAEPAPGR